LLIVSVALFLSFIFIWIRITFCRFRYDMLIMISWKVLLPFVLCIFICFIPILI
jgi:NADH:ubiquinone oxidoreductase subunit H